MLCPQCGSSNVGPRGACAGCGIVLPASATAAPTPSPRAGSLSAAVADETELYEAVIGLGGGLDFYLSRFRWFDAQGSIRSGWHWPAFFVTFWWMLYRKMWGSAVIYFLTPYLLSFTVVAVIAMAGQKAGGLLGAVLLVLYLGWIFIWIPTHATGMYYRHCKSKIAATKRFSRNQQKQLYTLAARGGTSGLVVVVIALFTAVPVCGVLAAIAIPQYVEYTARAQMKSVDTYATAARNSLAEHYYRTHRVPGSLEETGFNLPHPPMVGTVTIGKGGVMTLTFAKAPLTGKSLVFIPALDDMQQIVWECRSQDVPQRFLTAECRQPAP